MSGPRAPHSLRHEPQSTPLKLEEPPNRQLDCARLAKQHGIVSAVKVQQWQSDSPIAPEPSPLPPHDSSVAR